MICILDAYSGLSSLTLTASLSDRSVESLTLSDVGQMTLQQLDASSLAVPNRMNQPSPQVSGPPPEAVWMPCSDGEPSMATEYHQQVGLC